VTIHSEASRLKDSTPLRADSSQFELADFEEVVYCYFDPSSDTHLLQPFQALVLEFCANQTLTLSELSNSTAEFLDVAPDAEWMNKNRMAIEKMIKMSLIETA